MMHVPHYRARLLLPLVFVHTALLLAVFCLAAVPPCHAAALTVSFSIAPIPERSYTGDGNGGGSTVTAALARRSGTVTLTPGVAKIAHTTGSIHTGISYDGEDSESASDIFTRTFSVNGVGHPQTQNATIFGDGDEDSGDFYAGLSLQRSSTVTYDLGAQGKVDVTALAAYYNSDFPQPPLQYRFLLHDVPGLVAVKSVQISPSAVYGGAMTYGKVSLAAPAPSGGQIVTLSTEAGPEAAFPDTVTVAAGRSFVTFPIKTTTYPGPSTTGITDTPVSVSATAGGADGSAAFTVLGLYSVSGRLGLDNVNVTANSTGTFTLSSMSTTAVPIPDDNATGIVSTIMPSTVGTIDGLIVGVDITHPRITDLVITLQAPDGTTVFLHNKTGGKQPNLQTSYPVLNAPVDGLSAFTGKQVNGTWKLTVKDAAGGSVGTLNGWNLTFLYEGTVVGSAKTYNGDYSVPNLKAGAYTVAPSRTGITFAPKSRTVTVGPDGSPPSPTNVDFDFGPAVIGILFPSQDNPGGATLTGTVQLNKPAPDGGLLVTLSSAKSSLVSVPSSVMVAAGQTTATFIAKTHPPSGGVEFIDIKASGGGNSYDYTLEVDPGLGEISADPASVQGGAGATGTAALTGETLENAVVMLQSSNPSIVSVPASVTVAYYSSSITFPITTHAVGASTTVTITGTLYGVTKTTSVTVTP